jgi:hypothetical protein
LRSCVCCLLVQQRLLLLHPALQQVQLREDALQVQLNVVDVVVRAPGRTLQAAQKQQRQQRLLRSQLQVQLEVS